MDDNFYLIRTIPMEYKSKLSLSKKQSSQNNEYYYSQYKKIHDLSLTLSKQIHSTHHKHQQLIQQINHFTEIIQDLRDPIRRPSLQKKRKLRRTANQINKEFICEVADCLKEYATIASLKTHQKLKHPALHRTDDE